jgi:GDP-D-mannose dehydratase
MPYQDFIKLVHLKCLVTLLMLMGSKEKQQYDTSKSLWCSKVFGYNIVRNYRNAYKLHACGYYSIMSHQDGI